MIALDQAKIYLRRSLAKCYAIGYHARGLAYRRKGAYDEAIADFTEALRLNPERDVIYHARGLAYAEKGAYDEAIADYTEALRLNPEFAKAYHHRGLAYRRKGASSQAVADFADSLRLNPEDAVNSLFLRIFAAALRFDAEDDETS